MKIKKFNSDIKYFFVFFFLRIRFKLYYIFIKEIFLKSRIFFFYNKIIIITFFVKNFVI
jgi:hypothetical protein